MAANDSMEIFDYPGLHLTGTDGTAVVKVRMQEEEAVHKIGRGTSVCRPFTTGYKFELKDHPLESMNASYLLTEIQHVATVAGTYRDDAAGGGDSYTNHFTCIPADVMFRPARITPKPFVQGPQTAKIVGKSADQDSADDENAGETAKKSGSTSGAASWSCFRGTERKRPPAGCGFRRTGQERGGA